MAQIILKPDNGAPSIIVAGTIRTDRSVRAFSSRAPSYFPAADVLIAGIEDTIFISGRARGLSVLHTSTELSPSFENKSTDASAPAEIASNPFLRIYARADAWKSLKSSGSVRDESGIDILTISYRALELNRS
jgi:hypothetical protein